jgi:uncharacterized membrane protein YgcG
MGVFMKRIFSGLLSVFVVLFLMFSLSSCHRHKDHKIHCYKTHSHGAAASFGSTAQAVNSAAQTATSSVNDYLYWYVMDMNNNECYYYSSTKPIVNFASVNWTESKTGKPAELQEELKEPDAKEFPELEVKEADLPEAVENEMEQEGSPAAEEAPDAGSPDGGTDAGSSGGSDAGSSDGGSDGGGGGGD